MALILGFIVSDQWPLPLFYVKGETGRERLDILFCICEPPASLDSDLTPELPTVRNFPYFPGKSLPCPLYGNQWELYRYLKIINWPLKSTLTILHVHCTCTHMRSTWTSKVHILCRKFNGTQKRCKKNVKHCQDTQNANWRLAALWLPSSFPPSLSLSGDELPVLANSAKDPTDLWQELCHSDIWGDYARHKWSHHPKVWDQWQ